MDFYTAFCCREKNKKKVINLKKKKEALKMLSAYKNIYTLFTCPHRLR